MAVVSQAALSKAGSTLEDQMTSVEAPGLREQEQEVILGHIEKGGVESVGAPQGVSGDERLRKTGHRLCLAHETLQRSDQPIDDVVLRNPQCRAVVTAMSRRLLEVDLRHRPTRWPPIEQLDPPRWMARSVEQIGGPLPGRR